jgi:hypothetical protein
MGRNSDRYCRSVRHVSGDTPENLQIGLCAFRNLFFYSFEVETSTRSQNVQQTAFDSTHCLRIKMSVQYMYSTLKELSKPGMRLLRGGG